MVSRARLARLALRLWVRLPPRRGPEKVYIVLTSAFVMGGTIRTVLNLAGHLAKTYEVELISVRQSGDVAFFGEFPPGVKVVTLHDRRKGAKQGFLQKRLVHRGSVLMHRKDRARKSFNAWVDVQLARKLRGKRGFLITTRPGLNVAAALLSPPGLVLIGQEHMNLDDHDPALQSAMRAQYGKLAALVVLTEGDREAYERHLRGAVPVSRIPNTVRDLGGGRADLSARRVITAGRYAHQKGYGMLIRAWADVAPRHPDWRLRIHGEGPRRKQLEAQIVELGLSGSVSLEPPSKDLGGEMERASMFVLSSRFEGLPLVLLEAMSKGMGVVSFDCPTGPRDVIEDGRNGLLVPPLQVEQLGAALNRMIEDEDLRRSCAGAAVETAREYSMDVIGPQWEALLAEARERRR